MLLCRLSPLIRPWVNGDRTSKRSPQPHPSSNNTKYFEHYILVHGQDSFQEETHTYFCREVPFYCVMLEVDMKPSSLAEVSSSGGLLLRRSSFAEVRRALNSHLFFHAFDERKTVGRISCLNFERLSVYLQVVLLRIG